jgi:hypothetical protein
VRDQAALLEAHVGVREGVRVQAGVLRELARLELDRLGVALVDAEVQLPGEA